jgi:hypothetical protein
MAHSTKPSHDTTKWHFSFKNVWSRNTVQEKTFAATAVPYFPGEILYEIAERVVSPRDIINFCLMVSTPSLRSLSRLFEAQALTRSQNQRTSYCCRHSTYPWT